ncbi:MAG: glycosyltransferase family 2 protein [Anaerolineae bacterium]
MAGELVVSGAEGRARYRCATRKERSLPLISIIISTYDRPVHLRDLLLSLVSQSYEKFEIIVVDDASHQKVRRRNRETVERFGAWITIKLIESRIRLGTPKALNTGARHSQGNILVFTDDDCLAFGDWIGELHTCYQGSDTGGVGGRVIPIDNDIFRPLSTRDVLDIGRVCNDGIIASNFDLTSPGVIPVDHLSGANMSFLRESFFRSGGFDLAYTGNAYRFETDFCLKMARLGHKMLFNPRAIVYHRRASRGGNRIAAEQWYHWYARNGTYFVAKNFWRDGAEGSISNLVLFIVGHLRDVLKHRNIHPYARPSRWNRVFVETMSGILQGLMAHWGSERGEGGPFVEIAPEKPRRGMEQPELESDLQPSDSWLGAPAKAGHGKGESAT